MKKEIAEKYIYPKGRRHEDEATVVKYYYDAKRVVIGNRCLYAYFQNPNGFINSLGNEKNIDKIWALAHAAEFFEEKNETIITKKCWRRYFAHCLVDSVEHKDRCYEDIKNCAKLERLDKKMMVHVPFYLAAPKLYGVFARVHIKRHSKE